MWGPEDQERFDRDGLVTLPRAFDTDAAAEMSDAVWTFVEARTSVRRDDPATWPDVAWAGTSLKKLKRHAAFDAVLESADTRSALDAIFGVGAWSPSNSGAQILFSFPDSTPAEWRVPSSLWHMDAGLEPEPSPPGAVKLFSVVEPLPPRGGATMALTATPALQSTFARRLSPEERAGAKDSWRRFLIETDPWLARFADDDGATDRNVRLAEPHVVDGRTVELRELCGDPGDVHVTHINLFHSASPNAAHRPRLLVTHLVRAG